MTIPGLIIMLIWNAWLYELTLIDPKITDDELTIKIKILKQKIDSVIVSRNFDRINRDGKNDGMGFTH
tara:strand:- start:178 stop:381 length:204 start_codon:yes stop_codon:yes gene_type:complete